MPALATEDAFALAFPIDPPAGEALFAIELPPEAYATLTTADLADLRVVDAQGREQAVSLQRPPPPAPQVPDLVPLPLPIALPADTSSTPGALELHVRRDEAGQLSSLDLRSVDARGGTAAPDEWLLDLGNAAREGLDGLRLTPADDADFRVLVDVRASDDLVHWQTLQTALPLIRASNDGQVIERLDLRFGRTRARYLALRPSPVDAALPALRALAGLRLREPAPPPLATVVLEARSVSSDGRNVDYGAPGPLPVQEIDVQVSDGDGLLGYTLEQAVGGSWQPRIAGTAWRLSVGGESLASAPVDAGGLGHGALRLRLTQAAPPPRIVLGYRPDRLVVVAHGTAPYRLLAGSSRARGLRAPMSDTLAAVRLRQGQDWQPPLARLGPATALGGAAALQPPADPGRLGLWMVLALGAAVVGAMAWRLLRAPGAPEAPRGD